VEEHRAKAPMCASALRQAVPRSAAATDWMAAGVAGSRVPAQGHVAGKRRSSPRALHRSAGAERWGSAARRWGCGSGPEAAANRRSPISVLLFDCAGRHRLAR
jgi:hypothetical protein